MAHLEMFTAEQWKAWVERGTALVRTKTSVQFELGDITLEMVQHQPHDFEDHGVQRILAAYGDEVGLSASTLKNYRAVACAWTKEKRISEVSFAIHQALAAHPSRFSKIHNPPVDPVTKRRIWTVNEALRAAGRAPHHPVTAQERVDKVRDLITDDEDAAVVVREVLNRPAVVQKVMSDSSARHIINRVGRATMPVSPPRYDSPEEAVVFGGEYWKSGEAPGDEAASPRTNRAHVHYSEAPREVLELLGVCTAFYTQMQRLLPGLHVVEYDENTKQTLVASIDRVRGAANWAETVINTGDASMDEGLARLLKEGS